MLIPKMRVFKQVPRILFGAGSLSRVHEILPAKDQIAVVYDRVHETTGLLNKLNTLISGEFFPIDAGHEPDIKQVDELKIQVLERFKGIPPAAVVGVGGGCAMDLAKGTAILLGNDGIAADYQGWDLVKKPAIYKIGIPTLSGSGSEASRTAVFFNQDKKFGMNSDYTMFDAILLDSDLTKTAPRDVRFWTAMDCYIHSVEALQGTVINALAKAFAEQGLHLSRKFFLDQGSADELMVASYVGGASIVNSEVGICHALSYGLSLELGYRHGLANCIAFNVLEEYYGDYVTEFRTMLKGEGLTLPEQVCKNLSTEQLNRMVTMTHRMEKPLFNALGENWKEKLPGEKIIALYRRM